MRVLLTNCVPGVMKDSVIDVPCHSRFVDIRKAWDQASSGEIEERAPGVEDHEEAPKIFFRWLVSITISKPCPGDGNTSDSSPHLLCISALLQGHTVVEHGHPKSSPRSGIETERTVDITPYDESYFALTHPRMSVLDTRNRHCFEID